MGNGDEYSKFKSTIISPFDAALHQHIRIGFELVPLVVVDTGNKKVVILTQKFFDSCDDQGSIGIPKIVGDNSQSVSALFAQASEPTNLDDS